MTDAEVLELLQKVGAFRSGHFVFTSGLHADTYVNKDALYPYTSDTSRLCREIAERFKDKGIDAVVGPAIAAAILSQWTAYHLTEMTGKNVAGVYADKNGVGGFIIKRGYDKVIAGKNVLIVEDLTTTGGSIRRVVDAARDAGANVIGAIAVCNRGNVTAEQVGSPGIFDALVTVQLDQWPEAECELCKRGIPVNTDIGHGKEFLERKASVTKAS